MPIKICPADKVFSEFIRLRDRKCRRCGRAGDQRSDGLYIVGLQCSHYFGRGAESTRFDPDNCDSLCYGCHELWGSKDREAYREFKIKQLGQKKFEELTKRARTLVKRNRKQSLVEVKKLLKNWKKLND